MALDLAFEATGDGPPVVILHGLFGSGSNWRRAARELAGSHRVIAVDLRNHGASPWADSMSYLEMADDVLRLIEREDLSRPAVLGHSMGGKVAMALALMYPQQVGQLTVVDIAPVAYADRLSAFAEAMRAIDTLPAASREEVRLRLADTVPDAGVVPFLMQNLVARNAHFDWRLNLGGILAAMPALCAFPQQLRGLRYTRPVQVIAGASSDYVTPADADAFRPMFPATCIEVIEAAGHWVHADRPEAFIAAVRRSLQATALAPTN
jgi:pimeloyl-ACP methyl ester carboxylesterase